jgi:aminoglycoside phosphotransferase (APT) family kinase protein
MVTLVDNSTLVARVARRFMPRLKTQSEVATMAYLREHTPIPVPTVYHYDSNPYNRLGGEYILMSKVP